MVKLKKIIVNKAEEGNRIDKYLNEIGVVVSRTAVQRLLEEKKINVNNNSVKTSYKIQSGDVIEIEEEEPKDEKIKAQEIPLNVIYEDNDIIVINKPKGMIVHPGNGNPDGTLANAVMAKCKGSLSGIGGEIRPGIVHRLDKDTSGIIIVAKNDLAHINLSNQIKNREVKKTYIALVRGIVKENEATINMPIARSPKDRIKMAVVRNGKEAITHFKVLERYSEGFSLLEIKIDTGRTHQIRVHLAEIGYPVVGDYVYSNGKNPFGIVGQCLHAKKLEFNHPTTNKKMTLEAPLPEYFENVIKELRK
ncbi:MAG: RluA family pseudouridine synthase [Clostridia bacterium]|nr:RluA family pseudouridine synthase [Clostridia bacterium]